MVAYTCMIPYSLEEVKRLPFCAFKAVHFLIPTVLQLLLSMLVLLSTLVLIIKYVIKYVST